MHRITRQLVRIGDSSGSPFAGCFNAGTLGVRGGEVLRLDCLHDAGVVRGSNHSQSDENGRAPVGASPVGFHYAPFAAASGRGGFPHGIAGEGFEAFRGVGKALILEGFGCADSVGIVGLNFHNL